MERSGAELFEGLVSELRRYPGFAVVPKERSVFMRLLYYAGLMFLWCPDFLTSYTTVIVTRVYMPEGLVGTLEGYKVLRHEAVHMRDCLRSGVLFFVVSYLFVLPVVLTFRALWEYRAYVETMRVELELTGGIRLETVDWIAARFVSSEYLWMCPFPGLVRRCLGRARARLLAEAGHRSEAVQ